MSIAPKELLPIVIAGFLWGASWRGQLVTAHCDNMAVVEMVNSGYSKDGASAQRTRNHINCVKGFVTLFSARN